MLPLRLPEPGPLLKYVQWLISIDKNKGRDTARALHALLNSPNGAILLDLLQKSIEMSPIPISENVSALGARNAQAFIVADLRRLATDETDQLLAQIAAVASSGRDGKRPG
ncbi:MAG: hypothetical protein ACRC14_11865 [Paracoccaceae bacterium]